ncbi:MAG TPA: hypothetical protein VK509_17065 [Polyangiales bacterium]|nr:hypothetical protein [Polyangiales bacterium]
MANDPNAGDIALADAESAMHKGRAGSLVVMGGLGVAVVVGLVLLVGGEDQARVYGEIGKTINGLERAHVEQFWACALPGENIEELRTSTDLITKVDGRALERGRNYGQYVRGKCLPLLEEVGPKLDTLIAPDDLKAEIAAMGKANEQLRGAWGGFIGYLDDPELEYDQESAKPHVTAVARGWYEFKKAYAEVNKKMKAKLK